MILFWITFDHNVSLSFKIILCLSFFFSELAETTYELVFYLVPIFKVNELYIVVNCVLLCMFVLTWELKWRVSTTLSDFLHLVMTKNAKSTLKTSHLVFRTFKTDSCPFFYTSVFFSSYFFVSQGDWHKWFYFILVFSNQGSQSHLGVRPFFLDFWKKAFLLD